MVDSILYQVAGCKSYGRLQVALRSTRVDTSHRGRRRREGDAVAVRSSPTARRRQLGTELRRLRTEAGMTIDQVAERLECSESKISRVETGHVTALPRDVRDMLTLYGVSGDLLDELMQVARDARKKGWWHAYKDVPRSAYVGFESAAERISSYETMLVPGLLQTSAYARAVMHALLPGLHPLEIEHRVELRRFRQALLTRDEPPAMRWILDEAVLRRSVGGPEVMPEQLRWLATAAELPTVTIQVLRFEAGAHIGMYGPFTILSFREPAEADLVYLEHATRESYIEAEEELRRYRLSFDQLCRAALDPNESVELLVSLSKAQ
jgi:transcriptional regulator with XRE-family HTH domain